LWFRAGEPALLPKSGETAEDRAKASERNGQLSEAGHSPAFAESGWSNAIRVPMFGLRGDCLRIALRVMSFFARLTSAPPTREEIGKLKKCAESEPESGSTIDKARTVIDREQREDIALLYGTK
jgi:hypothetical protein